MYPDYLIHFNKNHSPKNGQFTSGDGDSDGVRDDHHNYSKNKVTSPDGKNISVSKPLSRYTGSKAEKYLKKDGIKKVRKIIKDEYIKKYGRTGRGKNLDEDERKYDIAYTKAYKKVSEQWKKESRLAPWQDEEFDNRMKKELSKMVDLTGNSNNIAVLLDLGFDKTGAEFVSKFLYENRNDA